MIFSFSVRFVPEKTVYLRKNSATSFTPGKEPFDPIPLPFTYSLKKIQTLSESGLLHCIYCLFFAAVDALSRWDGPSGSSDSVDGSSGGDNLIVDPSGSGDLLGGLPDGKDLMAGLSGVDDLVVDLSGCDDLVAGLSDGDDLETG